MYNRSDRHRKSSKLKIVTSGILLLATVFAWTERADTFILRWPFLSPVWSVPCIEGAKRTTFIPEKTISQPYFVTSVIWSADGKYLSVGSEFERNINIYNTSNWKIVSHFVRDGAAGDDNAVIAFNNLDDSLVVPRIVTPGNEDVSIELWDIRQNYSNQKYLAMWPNNGLLVPFSDERDSRPRAVGVSPSGRFLAASVGGDGDGYVIIFDKMHTSIIQQIVCAKYNVPTALSFNADNDVIVVGGCHLYDVEGYNVKTGERIFQTQVDYGNWLYNFVSYSPNGSLIAVGSSDAEHSVVSILQSSDGSIFRSFPRMHANITNLQWLNNNLVLASYDGWHPDGSVARVWDVKRQSICAEIKGSHLEFTSISPGGRLLAAVIGNKVTIGYLQTPLAGD